MHRQAERERKTLKGRHKKEGKKDEGKVRNPRFESLGSS